MQSHDNVTWTARIAMEHYKWDQVRLLSYLPLSHVAGSMIDIYMACYCGSEVHFADKDALKGKPHFEIGIQPYALKCQKIV